MGFKNQIWTLGIVIILLLLNFSFIQFRKRSGNEFLNSRYDWFVYIDTQQKFNSPGMRPTQYFSMTKAIIVEGILYLFIAFTTKYKAIKFIGLSLAGFQILFKLPDFWLTYNTSNWQWFILALIVLFPIALALNKDHEINDNRLDNN